MSGATNPAPSLAPSPVSRGSSSHTPVRKRPSRSDVFRPGSKLPLDPFAGLDVVEPTILDPDILHSLARTHESRRAVILITGGTFSQKYDAVFQRLRFLINSSCSDPTVQDISASISSVPLANSLIIIATVSPPPLPEPDYGPQIILLRLSRTHDSSSALKLASVLERACEVASAWRDAPNSENRVTQFSEAGGIEGAAFDVLEEPIFASSIPNHGDLSRLPSPTPSSHSDGESSGSSHLHARSPIATPPPTRPVSGIDNSRPASLYSFLSASSRASLASTSSQQSSKSTKSKKTKKKRTKIRNSNTRTFDAVINFIPAASRASDKTVLKSVVLLTTLGGGFLTGQPYGPEPSGRASTGLRTLSSPMASSPPAVGLGSPNNLTPRMRKPRSTDALHPSQGKFLSTSFVLVPKRAAS